MMTLNLKSEWANRIKASTKRTEVLPSSVDDLIGVATG